MSIASEIAKLQNNLSDSYTACQGKGATIPTDENFDNLATTIGTIPTGGGIVESLIEDVIAGNNPVDTSDLEDVEEDIAAIIPYAVSTTKTITENGTYNSVDDNANGYSSITVNVPSTQPVISSLNVTPTTSAQTIIAPSGIDGYSPVNISAVTSSIDNNIVAGNIKNGVSILGVTGNYTGTTPTLTTKNITQNGTYNASSDNADGYSSVTVNVSGVTPTGTKGITANGTYDVTNYAYASVNVSGGGGDSGGQYLVQVIDYDGTVLKQDHLNSGLTFTLPEEPTHTDMTFGAWCSPVQITNNTVTVADQDIIIGALYEISEASFDVELTPATGLNVEGYYVIDWGDGSTGQDPSTHTYSDYGTYHIIGYPYNGSSSNINYKITKVVGNQYAGFQYPCAYSRSLKLYTINKVQNSTLQTGFVQYDNFLELFIVPKNITTIDSTAFRDCVSLQKIVLPYGITTIGQNAFYNDYLLQTINIPDTVNSIGSSAFRSCNALKSIILPSGVTSIGKDLFYTCKSLEKVVCKGDIGSISAQAFYNNFSTLEYDFTHCTSVPTLGNTNAFTNINGLCKIKVPSSLAATWKTASNWSTYANYIVGV